MQTETPDLVIPDVLLPDMYGLDVLKELRTASAIPVIMLTSRGDESDRIVGLELGADDYLPKPFNPRELLARIGAVLRRQPPEEPVAAGQVEHPVITTGGMVLNTATRNLMLDGCDVTLSATEYQILRALMERPNTVLSRDQPMSLVRGQEFVAFDRSIDVHISKLRAKIEASPGTTQRIKTVRGAGYMFVDET